MRQVRKFCPKDRWRDIITKILLTVIDIGLESRTRLFQETYNIILRDLGHDPYKDQRVKLRELFKNVVNCLDIRGTSISELIRLSTSANMLDVEMREYKTLPEEVLSKLSKSSAIFIPSDEDILSRVRDAESVILSLDNAGEHMIDILLAHKLALEGKSVVLVSRRTSYEIDVVFEEVVEDLKMLNLDGVVRVESSEGPPVIKAIELGSRCSDGSVLVISKGIANFEAYIDVILPVMREYRDIDVLFCLAAKCNVLANLLGVGLGQPVVISSRYLGNTVKRIVE